MPTVDDYLSGAASRPVPVDNWRLDDGTYRPGSYVPPTPSPTPQPSLPPSPTYSSVARVVQAYKSGILNYNQAYDILINQFGFSISDAEDALGVEAEAIVNPPTSTPVVDETEDVIGDEAAPSQSLFDWERVDGTEIDFTKVLGLIVITFALSRLAEMW